MTHTDRIKQTGKRNRGVAQIDLVIANADVVIGVAVEYEDLDLGGTRTNLVPLARRADRGPQPGKSGPKDENARHAVLRLSMLRRFRGGETP